MTPAAGAGTVMVIVPVGTVHVGWVGEAVGAAGGEGGLLITTVDTGEVQPLTLAVTL